MNKGGGRSRTPVLAATWGVTEKGEEPRAHGQTDGADGEDKDGHRTPGQHFHGPGKRLLSPPAFTHSELLF